MRATAFLRRPTMMLFGIRFYLLGLECDGLWFLRCVRMLIASINVELLTDATTETILRQHAKHRVLEDALRSCFEHLLKRSDAATARIAGVSAVLFLLSALRSHSYFLRVDHDDEIAAVDVR